VIQQIDRPKNLYEQPANLFVAAFIGSPSMNLATATIAGETLHLGDVAIPLDARCRPRELRDGPVVLGIRPESLNDGEFADPSLPRFAAHADVIEELGSDINVMFGIEAPGVKSGDLLAAADGERESLFADDRARFIARFDRRSRVQPGSDVKVAIDPAAFYFFDVESGESLGGPAVSPGLPVGLAGDSAR
jgi:multiple sugar transport system ATP-binding protein